jgi:hypothetical protein
MGESDPNGAVTDHELDVNGISMSRGNGDDERLVLAM